MLLSPYTDLNHQDEGGRTTIWYAVDNADKELTTLLLQQKGLDPNYADKLGQTPLAKAASNGSLAMVKILFGQSQLRISQQSADALPPLW